MVETAEKDFETTIEKIITRWWLDSKWLDENAIREIESTVG